MKKLLLYAIVACITSVMPMNVKAAEAYAALSNDNKILTFYYDNEKSNRNGMGIGPFVNEDLKNYGTWDRGWHAHSSEITTVVFDKSFANKTDLTSTAYWFYKCNNLKTIEGIDYLKTDKVTDMKMMFLYCESLTSVDLSNFNTSNVTNMDAMFAVCTNLTSLDLRSFDTRNVHNMKSVFECCYNLNSLNISSFNTSNVTNMAYMFGDCYALESLDVSNFNTNNVTKMYTMFKACKKLKELDLSSFNTSRVTNMKSMFRKCEMLTTIYVSHEWSTEKADTSSNMFDESPNIVGGSGTVWDENHTDYTYAHIDGGPSNPGYLTFKNAGEQTGEQTDKKCSTPTIAFVDGELVFSCETEDVEYVYEITSEDVKMGNASKVTIGGKYHVSVYATKVGYEDSDVVTKDIELSAGAVGDVNGDGVIDVSDYIGVANIILTGNIQGK